MSRALKRILLWCAAPPRHATLPFHAIEIDDHFYTPLFTPLYRRWCRWYYADYALLIRRARTMPPRHARRHAIMPLSPLSPLWLFIDYYRRHDSRFLPIKIIKDWFTPLLIDFWWWWLMYQEYRRWLFYFLDFDAAPRRHVDISCHAVDASATPLPLSRLLLSSSMSITIFFQPFSSPVTIYRWRRDRFCFRFDFVIIYFSRRCRMMDEDSRFQCFIIPISLRDFSFYFCFYFIFIFTNWLIFINIIIIILIIITIFTIDHDRLILIIERL